MARSIKEIKDELTRNFVSQEAVRDQYGLPDNVSFDKAFSPVSIESVLLYVVASCVWVVECLFDCHKEEVESAIENLRPHTLRWYVSKVKQFIYDAPLTMTDGIVTADYFDEEAIKKQKGWDDAKLEAQKIVKYAVATEDNTTVYIKVAKRNAQGNPVQLNTDRELPALEYYLSQIKDAGVLIKIINEPADTMNVELLVLYDPTVLKNVAADSAPDKDGYSELSLQPVSSGSGEKTDIIETAVQKVISELPFNGEYRNSDLMAAVQAIDGVKVVDVLKVEADVGGSQVYTPVVGYRRPGSGYYSLNSLKVKGRAYQVVE